MIRPFETSLRGNGRYRAMGLHTMDAIEQIRARGLEAAIEAMATVGGVVDEKDRPRMARDLLNQIQRTPAAWFRPWVDLDVPLQTFPDGSSSVERISRIPTVSWSFLGSRQIGRVKWYTVSRVVHHLPSRPTVAA
ncbi:MAG: hypothetical protein KAY22_07420 [Rhizorhabdus sp.]|uniref:hypothetical protein n=1 Tax=Rhizorhabdus sp. TaxID=1968843 RepID=UPI001B50C1FD|nr:hypothetical protein [Rhizorhabdus sp.]MBP8232118.1 hypothetical protein [Rhizorhabdus sp.]